MRAALEPGKELSAVLAQAVMHIDLVRLIARKSHVQPMQLLFLQGIEPFDLIQEVALAMAPAEEQPVASRGAVRHARLQESPERRDTRSRPYHDHIARAIVRQPKAWIWLEIRAHLRPHRQHRELPGSGAYALLAVALVIHECHGQVRFAANLALA